MMIEALVLLYIIQGTSDDDKTAIMGRALRISSFGAESYSSLKTGALACLHAQFHYT